MYRGNNLSLIVAIANNGIIGRNNRLPWRLPSDLKRFKEITTLEHTLIMGRKTYDSIIARNGTPLQGRIHIVLTHECLGNSIDTVFVPSIEDALVEVSNRACVIGGEQVYRLFLPYVSRAYVTEIYGSIPMGDAKFPDVDWGVWRKAESKELSLKDASDQYRTSYAVYERNLS